MSQFLRLTAKRNDFTNKVNLKKGMFVEIICSTSHPNIKEMEKIAELFANKYGTICTKGYITSSDFIIEKIG